MTGRGDDPVMQRHWLDADRVAVRLRASSQRHDAGGDGGDAVALLRARMRDARELRGPIGLRRDQLSHHLFCRFPQLRVIGHSARKHT